MTDTMTNETTEAVAVAEKTPAEILRSAIRDWMQTESATKRAAENLRDAQIESAKRYNAIRDAWVAADSPTGSFSMYTYEGNKIVSLCAGTHGSVNISVQDELKL